MASFVISLVFRIFSIAIPLSVTVRLKFPPMFLRNISAKNFIYTLLHFNDKLYSAAACILLKKRGEQHFSCTVQKETVTYFLFSINFPVTNCQQFFPSYTIDWKKVHCMPMIKLIITQVKKNGENFFPDKQSCW